MEKKGLFTIAGMSVSTTLEDTKTNSTIPKLMNDFFENRVSELAGIMCGKGGFGMFIDPPNYNPTTDEFQWIAGVEVNSHGELPEDFVRKTIPAHTYAVITYTGHVAGLGEAYNHFYQTWLPNSSYELADSFGFEYTDESFKGPNATDNVVELYFPVKKK